MADREPTIEQNSHFTAKTQQGQDVEFIATLRFYVSPTGQVSISAPGTSTGQSDRSTSNTSESEGGIFDQGGRPSSGYQNQPSAPPQAQVEPPRTDVREEKDNTAVSRPKRESGSGERVVEGNMGTGKIPRDETIDRAFPRGPPSDCPITQFIPDPCRAIDDIQKSIKSLFSGYFSGRQCPPPQNTDNPRTPDEGLYVNTEEGVALDTIKESKAESEIMEKEQKYEM